MKTILFSTPAIALALALSSCADMGPNQQRGAATGAVVGGLGGAIIGNQSGHAGEGALIGAGAGALIGNSYGNARDQDNYRRGY